MKLREYQETAADFLYQHDRAMVLASVGAGKTAISLTAMWRKKNGVADLEKAKHYIELLIELESRKADKECNGA